MLKKVSKFLEVVRIYKNWPTFFRNRFGLIKDKFFFLKLRNDVIYKLRSYAYSKSDAYVINEAWLYDLHIPILKRHLKSDRVVVFDLGANIGSFSIQAAHCGAKVFCYEPETENFEMLEENIKINHLEGRITPIKKAVMGKSGERELFIAQKDGGYHSFFKENFERGHMEFDSEKVPMTTLGEEFEKYGVERCSLLKLDIEGAEYEILYNLSDAIWKKIDAISLEPHDVRGEDHGKLERFIQSKGFSMRVPYKDFPVAWFERRRN